MAIGAVAEALIHRSESSALVYLWVDRRWS
jgi:hypothetical protein